MARFDGPGAPLGRAMPDGRAVAVVATIAGCIVVLALLAGGRLLAADAPPSGTTIPEGSEVQPTTTIPDTTVVDEEQDPPPPERDAGEGTDFLSWLLGVLVTLVAAVGVGLAIGGLIVLLLRTEWVRARRGLDPGGRTVVEPAGGEAEHDRTVMAESLATGATRLDATGDARAAIIACYAALLVGLESCAQGRHPAETPDEHLERVLAALEVRPDPLRELTTLFGEARFSDHEMTEAQRDRARAALVEARSDLDRVSVAPEPEPVA